MGFWGGGGLLKILPGVGVVWGLKVLVFWGTVVLLSVCWVAVWLSSLFGEFLWIFDLWYCSYVRFCENGTSTETYTRTVLTGLILQVSLLPLLLLLQHGLPLPHLLLLRLVVAQAVLYNIVVKGSG